MNSVNVFSRELKDGTKSWGYRFEIASVDGKRKQPSKSGFKTKKEAQRAGMNALQEYEKRGTIKAPIDISFSDYLDLWMDKACIPELKQTTVDNYQKKIKNHIKPVLGRYRVNTITHEQLQDFVINLYDNGMSLNTISVISGILSKAFNYAVDNYNLPVSPAVRLKPPRNKRPKVLSKTYKRDIIPQTEIQAIFERFPETSPSHIPLMFGYKCGMRISEAFAVVWEDIDFDNKTITINRQIQWKQDKERTTKDKATSNGKSDCGNGYWYFSNPKYNSVRTIDIDNSLLELLKREKARQDAMKEYYSDFYTTYYSQSPLTFNGELAYYDINCIGTEKTESPVNFVCVRECGTYISNRTMQHTSSVIRKDIFNNFCFHSLRHTHSSILSGAGMTEKYISERLGHSDTKVTKRVYIHVTDSERKHGIDKLNELFQQG